MPYLPEQRQYRSFAATNFQPVRDSEGTDAPPYRVRGHFTTFEDPYELMPGYYECVASTALDECDMSDVIFQYDHQGMVLARQRNDSLRVGVDAEGGWCEATLDGCQQARDLYEAITNGLVDEMSFGFTIADDGFEWTEDDDGNIQSRITKISKIFDVSGVSVPANPGTEISARSLKDAIDEARAKKAEAEEAKSEQVEERKAEELDVKAFIASMADEVKRMSAIADKLASIPLVFPATEEQIEKIAERMDEVEERAGEEVVEERDSDEVVETPEDPDVVQEQQYRARMRRARAMALKTI